MTNEEKLKELEGNLAKSESELAILEKSDSTVNESLTIAPSKSLVPYKYNPAIDEGLWLSGMIMLFSLTLVGFMTYLIKHGSELQEVLKVFGTVLVVVASVFLVVAGYSEKQIAPVIGLLGTIVGYILGKNSIGQPIAVADKGTKA